MSAYTDRMRGTTMHRLSEFGLAMLLLITAGCGGLPTTDKSSGLQSYNELRAMPFTVRLDMPFGMAARRTKLDLGIWSVEAPYGKVFLEETSLWSKALFRGIEGESREMTARVDVMLEDESSFPAYRGTAHVDLKLMDASGRLIFSKAVQCTASESHPKNFTDTRIARATIRQALLMLGKAVAESGQVKAFALRENLPASPMTPPAIRNVHVLVVGVGDYRDKSIRPLNYSAGDARAVYEFFAASDRSPARRENVHFVGEEPNAEGLVATRAGIEKAITKYLIEQAVHEDDMAILYFSGHADAAKHPVKSAGYYLLPLDAEAGSLYDTAIEVEDLQKRWDAIRAKTKVLVADACNVGGFAKLKDLNIRGLDGLQGGGTVVMAAAAASESSLELDVEKRGLFTHAFLEGLQGKADTLGGNSDGRVSLAELKLWLEEQVPSAAARAGGKQTPVIRVPPGWEGLFLTR